MAGTFTFLGMHFVFSTKNRVPNKDKFGWQDGYGAFSVSKSAEDTVIQYIRNQQEHHRKKSFQEEFIEFLNKHGIDTMKIIFGNKEASFRPFGACCFVFKIRGLHPLLYPNGISGLNL